MPNVSFFLSRHPSWRNNKDKNIKKIKCNLFEPAKINGNYISSLLARFEYILKKLDFPAIGEENVVKDLENSHN